MGLDTLHLTYKNCIAYYLETFEEILNFYGFHLQKLYGILF